MLHGTLHRLRPKPSHPRGAVQTKKHRRKCRKPPQIANCLIQHGFPGQPDEGRPAGNYRKFSSASLQRTPRVRLKVFRKLP